MKLLTINNAQPTSYSFSHVQVKERLTTEFGRKLNTITAY
ncbi:MAG: hypothetical protein ACJAVY_001198 [Marinoscillum sp.]|jgi:hypothetical protein